MSSEIQENLGARMITVMGKQDNKLIFRFQNQIKIFSMHVFQVEVYES